MHIYPLGAAVNGRHRPCGPQGKVTHGSEVFCFVFSKIIIKKKEEVELLFGVEQFVI